MPRGKKSVANYAPEMLELFQHGHKTPIEVSFATAGQASNFGYRMNRLRMAMRDEEHWLLPSAEACSIAIDREKKTVTIKPVDISFIPRIREALSRLPEQSKEIQEQELSHEVAKKIHEESLSQSDLLKKFLSEPVENEKENGND